MSATLYHQTVIHHIYLYQGWKLNIRCYVTLYTLPSFENGPHFGARGPGIMAYDHKKIGEIKIR